MQGSYLERNAAGLARLRALVERLGEEELARPVGGEWTVAALLAHLAFWDRFVLARWRGAAREGHQVPQPVGDVLLDLINEAALEEWRALPPGVAARQALAAAEAAERLIAGLGDDAAGAALASGRLPLLDRTLHWTGHLDEIEGALSTAPEQAP